MMINFKGALFSNDVIMYAFFPTSGMVFLNMTLKKLWKKGELNLSIPHSIVGLSSIHLS
jgi:hypothetical protein